MAQYEAIEYWLEIAKAIEILFYYICAYKIYHANKTTLNKVYAIAFLVWTGYTWADVIMWISGANSPTWLIMANLIRDFQIFCAMVFAFLIFFTTEIIVRGIKGLKRKKLYLILGVFILLTVFLAIFDRLDVYNLEDKQLTDPADWTTGIVQVQPNISTITAVLMAFPLILYIWSVVSLVRLIRHSSHDMELKRRMYALIIGIVLIPTGILYFTVILGFSNLYNIFTAFLGRGIWILSPIFIYRSQRISHEKKIVESLS